jgi:anti-sigma regulatory factor (Ser/Thr protein kinase)
MPTARRKLPCCLPGTLHATNERVPLMGGEAQDRAIRVLGVTDSKATFRQRGDLYTIITRSELIVSELMTNALKAARPLPDIQPITLYLQASDEYLMIQVWDALSAAPAPRPHAIDSETGRGLEIVALLSDRWGFYHPAGGGKVVWAALITGAAPSAPHGAGT